MYNGYLNMLKSLAKAHIDDSMESIHHEARALARYYVKERDRIVTEFRKFKPEDKQWRVFEPLTLVVSRTEKATARDWDGSKTPMGIRIVWTLYYRNRRSKRRGSNTVPKGKGPMYERDKLLALAKEFTKNLVEEVEYAAALLRLQSQYLMECRRKIDGCVARMCKFKDRLQAKAEADQFQIPRIEDVVRDQPEIAHLVFERCYRE